MAEGLIVFGAGLGGDSGGDLPEEGGIPGGGHADGLREHRGVAGAGDAVEAFVPPVVGGDAEAWDGGCGVDELRGLFFEGHAGDEVFGALLGGEGGVLIGERLSVLRERAGGEGEGEEPECETCGSGAARWHRSGDLRGCGAGESVCRGRGGFGIRRERYASRGSAVKQNGLKLSGMPGG